ncbi:hypothetical protein LPJ61_005541, partial [Coemansia biformis]
MGVLGACRDATPDTKASYESCIALWIGTCDENCVGDDLITEQRLTDYTEWLA